MEFDLDELKRQYKQIQKTCISNGSLVPSIIPTYKIPKKNKLSNDELDELVISEEMKDKIFNERLNRRKTEHKIFADGGDYYDYLYDELRNFLIENPEFKSIVLLDE